MPRLFALPQRTLFDPWPQKGAPLGLRRPEGAPEMLLSDAYRAKAAATLAPNRALFRTSERLACRLLPWVTSFIFASR